MSGTGPHDVTAAGAPKELADEAAEQIIGKVDESLPGSGETAERVQESPAYRVLVTAGLIAYGVVHLLLAVLVVQVIRGDGVDASQDGSIKALAGAPFGFVLVVLIAVGMAALSLWQILLALYGFNRENGVRQLRVRASAVGRALLYASLSFVSVRTLVGVRRDSSGLPRETSSLLLSQWFGPPLLVVAGAVVVGVGVAAVLKGVRRTFVHDDLDGDVPGWAVVLGAVGWTMKGVALGLVGGLLWVAAWTRDPAAAGSVDAALKAVAAQQPWGIAALLAAAAGFTAFGIYCFWWARHARHDVSAQQAR